MNRKNKHINKIYLSVKLEELLKNENFIFTGLVIFLCV